AQEVLKVLHGLPALLGRGFVFDGEGHGSYGVTYPVKPDCPWHDEPAPIVERDDWGSATPWREVWDWAAGELGGVDAIDFARERVEELECPGGGRRERVLRPVEKVAEDQARCGCGAERVPRFLHALQPESPLLERRVGETGLPAWDVVWARRGERMLGVEF